MMGDDHQTNGPPSAYPHRQDPSHAETAVPRGDIYVSSSRSSYLFQYDMKFRKVAKCYCSQCPKISEASEGRPKCLTVSDAMDYLDSVKLEYRNQPEIYDQFLAIMGRFKSKQILPPEVIGEVARLFRGRHSLVLRFNRFLPEDFKIGPNDIERLEEQQYIAEEQATARAQRTGDVQATEMMAIPAGDFVHSSGVDDDTVPYAVGEDKEDKRRELGDEGGGSGGDDGDGEESGRTREFDHAIHYVTTIKRRFVTDPGMYKAFLDILHTYQREHRGINDVLEQVTGLFADQPDLLREFTYFLPDTVQAHAKERLDEAALEAEIRLGFRGHNGQLLQRPWKHGGYPRGQGRVRDSNIPRDQGGRRMQQRTQPGYGDSDYDEEWRREQGGYGRVRASPYRGSQAVGYGSCPPYANGEDLDRRGPRPPQSYPEDISQRVPRKGRQAWCHAEDYELGSDGVFKGPKKRTRSERQPGGWSSADAQGGFIKPSEEQQLFDRARVALSFGGESNDWNDFLKCLDLFNNHILKREHMLNCIQDLFENHNDLYLFDEIKNLIDRRGELDPPYRDAQSILGLSEINFQSAKKCTPSYRELPEEYQSALCSGRSADEETVLNDTWVSVPVGSEDSNNFKHMRRNPHEEALFKTEDERFELDMLKDGVAATIARLEPIEEEIEALKATAGSATLGDASLPSSRDAVVGGAVDVCLPHLQYRLDRRTLGALHLSTVSRLYGEHGTEVVELMRKNPAVAIPVVLRRLRKKKREWTAAREAARSGWKEIAQKNFHRSLDHRSYYFRREDKRVTSNRTLLQELKDKKVEEDPQSAAVVKASREKVNDPQDDPLLGRISPTSTAADADSVSVGQGSAGEADAALDGATSDSGVRGSSDVIPESLGDKSGTVGRGPRSKEGIQLMRQQAEESAPWYMFAHLTLLYPGDTKDETASVHADIMDLLSHTLSRRPPSEEDVRQASAVVADLLPTFFALSKSKLGDTNGGRAGFMIDARQRTKDVLQGELTLPVMSSDNDSHRDNSQSSGDEQQPMEHCEATSSRRAEEESSASRLGTPTRGPAKGTAGGAVGDIDSVESSLRLENQEVFYTTTDFYLALRMHHVLAGRLFEAKRLCRDAKSSRQAVVASPHEILQARAGGVKAGEGHGDSSEGNGYKTFLGHVYDLLDDKTTTERYEEGVRQLVGNQGYVLCNLDRLVMGLLQNLYRASADKVFQKLTHLYHYERATQIQGVSPALYKSHTQHLLHSSDKEVVRVQYHPGAPEPNGRWQVIPTLKMEYIGPMDTHKEEQSQENSGEANANARRTDENTTQTVGTIAAMEE